jgi:hypothetical protein
MPLTLLRQDDDVRKSDVYDDTVAPSLANFETNPVSLEDDLSSLRSALQNFLNRDGASFPAGNWYDDVSAPITFEGGSKRGINKINQELHDLERKRVLVSVSSLADVAVPATQNYVVLALSELPSNTTAAVGAVTTRGTVAAAHGGSFGTSHSLTEVGGSTAISPKNLCEIVDGATRDPILSSGRTVYALFQTETATDGHTMTGTTPVRAQLSFVRITAAGDDLEACPVADIESKTINYASVERKALEDLSEQDFLRGAVTDVPSSATVTRQVAYDNQGATPVNLTTNATLDLEGAGLIWKIRDDLEADLLRVVEGSAGGTSTVHVAQDVDTFDVDAVDNDFRNGATFGTVGTGIQIAETAGIIERAGNLTLLASGAGELFLDDSNRTGSTFAQAGVKLSETTAEWDAYEAAFGGEVSLLNAVVQAYNNGAAPSRLFHVASGNVAADADVGGPGTAANNLDVDFPDGFVTAGILNTHLFLNGRLMRPGANAAANNDYYPGTSFTAGNVELKFERAIKSGDQLASYVY